MSGDREFKQPALASWERLQAERDEWKARAEKAEAELTDAQWERESLREKANGLEVERADAVRDLTRMLDNGAQTLAMVRASRREVSAERDRLQEQVEQARRIMARVVGAWADVSGGEPDEAVEAFDFSIYVMSRFLAETEPTESRTLDKGM